MDSSRPGQNDCHRKWCCVISKFKRSSQETQSLPVKLLLNDVIMQLINDFFHIYIIKHFLLELNYYILVIE